MSKVFAMAAVAIAGLAFSVTPLAEHAEGKLLDLQWSLLRKLDPRPAPDDIVIVGIDEASAARIREPAGLWHEPLGMALVRIASARPRAIGLDLALPERSQEAIRPGLDRALLVGLAAARQNGPFVASLSIDASTRAAKPIHLPFLALLQEERLGLGLLARDADGVVRRFSTLVPTEDGGFPTLAGRMCRALARGCADGLIHYALGGPFRLVPLHQVLETNDVEWLAKAFRDRIVLIGETRAHAGRVAVPVNYAGWEAPSRSSPAVVVHAQSLRTALMGAAPQEVSRAVMVLLVSLAALVYLVRDWRLAAVTGTLAAAALLAAGVLALRSGLALALSAALATLAAACLARFAQALFRKYEIRRR